MTHHLTRAGRLLAAGLLALAAASCASGPSDPGAALDQKRGEAARLASQGRQAQQAGRLREAVELYLQSLETYDELPGVRTNLGVALLDSGDILKGSDMFKEEVQLFPANAQGALTNLGIIYKDARQFGPARDYFFRALELTPNDPLALRGAVEACMATDYDEEKTLDLLLRGLMVERDPKVLDDYKWRQIRLEARIKDRPKYRAGEDHIKPKRRGKPVGATDPEAAPTTPASPTSPTTPPASPTTPPPEGPKVPG